MYSAGFLSDRRANAYEDTNGSNGGTPGEPVIRIYYEDGRLESEDGAPEF